MVRFWTSQNDKERKEAKSVIIDFYLSSYMINRESGSSFPEGPLDIQEPIPYGQTFRWRREDIPTDPQDPFSKFARNERIVGIVVQKSSAPEGGIIKIHVLMKGIKPDDPDEANRLWKITKDAWELVMPARVSFNDVGRKDPRVVEYESRRRVQGEGATLVGILLFED